MKIFFPHLNDFLKEDTCIKDVSDKLFQLGHENEFTGDIFDIDFTPNRGDALSLLGLARDLNFFFENDLSRIEIFKDEIKKFNFSFDNLSPQNCPKISFLNIKIKNQGIKYKKYLSNFFEKTDQKKINFFTDVSNYLLYEIGQPTHCYDQTTLDGKLSFECLSQNEEFETLLGQELKLSPGDCVFKLNNKVINLAGIIGGMKTACSSNTDSAVIECAYFNPESIVGKMTKYGIKSDAGYRFERGTDHSIHDFALRRFIQIIKEHVEIVDLKIIEHNSEDFDKKLVDLNTSKIQDILGIEIEEKDILKILQSLGFTLKDNKLHVPHHRSDIATQNDIAEEVARVFGYDNFPRKKNFSISQTKRKSNRLRELDIKTHLVNNGFFEVINYPFTNKNTAESIIVDNPLEMEKRFLRRDLESSLLSNLIFNENRQKDMIKIFEISNTYKTNNSNIIEDRKLSILVSGRQGHNYNSHSLKLDSVYLNRVLSEIFETKCFDVYEIKREQISSKSKNKIFASEINLENVNVIVDRNDKKFKNNYMSTDNCLSTDKKFKKYEQISEYPMIKRDLSFSSNDSNNLKELEDLIFNFKNNLLKKVFIFDFYVPENGYDIKIGYSFLFQSPKKTLTDQEIDSIIDDIVRESMGIKGIEVPRYNLKK